LVPDGGEINHKIQAQPCIILIKLENKKGTST